MFWGFVLSSVIGFLGHRKGALSRSGALGAVLVGTLIFGLGGWDWGFLLIAFFVSSSLLSRYREGDKEAMAEKFAKGSQRDMGQALANAGLGSLLAIGAALCPDPLWLMAYVGAMGTVNADTWATEIGVLNRTQPRLITTGRPVEVGSSGGVSLLGTLATLAGGILIGLLAALFELSSTDGPTFWFLLLAGAVGGLAGSLFDSLLGATVQAIYYCDHCAKETERTLHRCGNQTRRLRGWRWLNNDLVNLISSGVGAVVAVGLSLLLS